MSHVAEKGGAAFHGIKLLLCENPLPPLDEAIAAAQAEVPHSNYYTEPCSACPSTATTRTSPGCATSRKSRGQHHA